MSELPPRALLDPALCMAPGLFRSVARGDRGQPLAISYQHGPEAYLFRSPVLLGCDDLRVLQGIVALARDNDTDVRILGDRETAALRSRLALSGNIAEDDFHIVGTSFAEIARVVGYGGGRGGAMGRQIRSSLDRLAGLEVAVSSRGIEQTWRLIAWDEDGTPRRNLRIALNPSLTGCARGFTRYVIIDMHEARSLRGDVARILHQRLSGLVDPPLKGRRASALPERRLRLDTMIGYVWPAVGLREAPNVGAAARRQRRVALRDALSQFDAVRWRIEPVPGSVGKYAVARPPKWDGGPVGGLERTDDVDNWGPAAEEVWPEAR